MLAHQSLPSSYQEAPSSEQVFQARRMRPISNTLTANQLQKILPNLHLSSLNICQLLLLLLGSQLPLLRLKGRQQCHAVTMMGQLPTSVYFWHFLKLIDSNATTYWKS